MRVKQAGESGAIIALIIAAMVAIMFLAQLFAEGVVYLGEWVAQ